jgi:ATP-dependent DNA helicase RecG
MLRTDSKSQLVENQQLLIHFEPVTHHPTLSIPEIFDTVDQHLLNALFEDRRLEHKPPSIHCKELGEYISMWANSGPDGGLIVIGIEDGGVMKGLTQQGPKRWNELQVVSKVAEVKERN